MMQGTKGMKMPRGDKNLISNYIVPIPPLDEQKKIVAEVLEYESEISKAKAVMRAASARKQAILRKYGVIT